MSGFATLERQGLTLYYKAAESDRLRTSDCFAPAKEESWKSSAVRVTRLNWWRVPPIHRYYTKVGAAEFARHDDCQECVESEIARLEAWLELIESGKARVLCDEKSHSGICVMSGNEPCKKFATLRLRAQRYLLSRFTDIPKAGDVIYVHDDPYCFGGKDIVMEVDWHPGRGHYLHLKESFGQIWDEFQPAEWHYPEQRGIKWSQEALAAYWGDRWALDDSDTGGHNTAHDRD